MPVFQLFRGRGAANNTDPVATPPTAVRVDALPILSASALLQPHAKTIGLIQRQVAIPLIHWDALYEQLLHNFAAFVQQLPASEAHHHRQAGGLLAHSLDCTLQALRIRRGILLPTGATAEQLAEKQDVWTYTTVTAALLHDLGKPVVDQAVQLFDAEGGELALWNPLSGPMPPSAAAYKFSYVRGRRYRLHPRIPPLLVQFIVPPVGLAWMAQDIDVFEAWLATITGGDSEFSGKLGQIISQADSLSVAADISGGATQPAVGSAPTHSFAERLAIALRQLIDAQTLPLNRPGAAGWVIGDDLWLVSKRALDALREQLAKDSAGASAPRNERLMDELQQHGIVMANGDRAIWTATIELAQWKQRLTLLRIPLSRLWIDPASRPTAIEGRVVPEGESSPIVDATAAISQPPSTAPSAESPTTTTAEAPADWYADLPLPPMGMSADESDTAPEPTTVLISVPPQLLTTDPVPPPTVTTNGSPVFGESKAASLQPAPSKPATTPTGNFFDWVREGIAAGRLNVNTPNARLHVTSEGLLMVSPGIFRDFAGVEGWNKAQKKVQQLEIHSRKPDGTNIWTYRVIGQRKSSARLKGIVIPEPGTRLGLTLPEPNPHLCLLQLDSAATAGGKLSQSASESP